MKQFLASVRYDFNHPEAIPPELCATFYLVCVHCQRLTPIICISVCGVCMCACVRACIHTCMLDPPSELEQSGSMGRCAARLPDSTPGPPRGLVAAAQFFIKVGGCCLAHAHARTHARACARAQQPVTVPTPRSVRGKSLSRAHVHAHAHKAGGKRTLLNMDGKSHTHVSTHKCPHPLGRW